MLDKQKQIIKVLSDVLPQMSEETQNYLLGFGEGLAAAQKKFTSFEENMKTNRCESRKSEEVRGGTIYDDAFKNRSAETVY